MPFEPAPKQLSAAEQLAALIEAGCAANPLMKHRRKSWGDGRSSGCAMTFAMKAAGMTPEQMGLFTCGSLVDWLSGKLGVDADELRTLIYGVIEANDDTDLSLQEIADGLRAGRIKHQMATYAYVTPGECYFNDALNAQMKALAKYQNSLIVTYFGDPANFTIGFDLGGSDKPAAKPQAAKKVRTSAKNGATWPVAKHAYA